MWKRILRYLKGTIDYCLRYEKRGEEQFNLIGFVGADWAGDPIDRKSFTGYLFKLGGNPISWESKKQHSVALSSTEAEYVGLIEACKEAIHLRRVLTNIISTKNKKILIYNDNQSVIKLSSNPVYHSRTKHIDIKQHFVRECVDKGYVYLEYMSTEHMPADVLTKGLVGAKHQNCVKGLDISNVP